MRIPLMKELVAGVKLVSSEMTSVLLTFSNW
jgi:hypothetical protein